MYEVIENINSISATEKCFLNIKIFFDLDGSSFVIGKQECKRYFILCTGSASLLLENENVQKNIVQMSQSNAILVDANVNVTLTDFSKTTKIICIEESAHE